MTPEEIHRALDVVLQGQLYSRLKFSDWELGADQEHANYRLAKGAPDENMQIHHSAAGLFFVFSLPMPLDPTLMTRRLELGNCLWFDLKLVSMCSLAGSVGDDESEYPVVRCRRLIDFSSRASLHQYHIDIPAAEASVALAAAVIETVLLEYLV